MSLRPIITVAALTLVAAVGVSQVARTWHGDAPPREARTPQRTWLGIQHLRQEPMLCVPTSAAMVLAYYGDTQPPRRIKVLSRGQDYDPRAPFNDFTITLFSDLVRGLGTLGYAWSQETFPDTPEGFAAGLDRIEDELRNGRPVLVDSSFGPIGHTVVISGFDLQKRELYLVDPDMPPPGRASVAFDRFEALWNEHATGGHFRAMVVTGRKPG